MNKKYIKLIVYDFDGVMTDNRVLVSQDGSEFVTCDRGDGLGVNIIKSMGIPQVILSTETNVVVQQRAQKIGVEAIYGADDKKQSLLSYCDAVGVNLDTVLYVGNDVNDLEAMKQVGFPVCPANAHPMIQRIALKIMRAKGGYGVIRELADWLSFWTDQDDGVLKKNVPKNDIKQICAQIEDGIRLRHAILGDQEMLEWISFLSDSIFNALKSGGKIILAGNGGSFADAQHLSAEFVGRFVVERGPLAAICLGTNSSLVTAVGNDYSFDEIFSREMKCLASSRDILIVISTSGNSDNLKGVVDVAESLNIPAYGLLGKGGGCLAKRVSGFIIPSDHTPRIQEIHITVGHILCDLVDERLVSDLNKPDNNFKAKFNVYNC